MVLPTEGPSGGHVFIPPEGPSVHFSYFCQLFQPFSVDQLDGASF